MTAIIGILNKTTVALAADSAATVGPDNNSKVYNNANKLFNLTHNNPVGIAIHGMSEVMGIPWETIIKMYRQQFSHKGFDTLTEYGDDFLRFLGVLLVKHTTQEEQLEAGRSIILGAMREVNFAWESRMSAFPPEISPEEREALLSSELLSTIEEVHTFITTNGGRMPQFADYRLEEFTLTYGPKVREIAIESLEKGALTEAHFEKLIALSHLLIGGTFFYEQTTGIVISGFGEAEIYPALQSYSIGGIINNTVRYATQRTSVITRELPVDVIPFAQTDSIWGFLNGITPKMQERVVGLMDLALSRFSEHMLEQLDLERTPEVEKVLADAATSVLGSLTHEISQAASEDNFIPILSTIISLSKEDLAYLAESLINLTYLQRRASFTQESVGGPIDVAIITKGDGFVWIKRKHYFKPESNLNYLARVLSGQGQLQHNSHENSSNGDPVS
jgi:hypothetical protein